MTCLCIVLLDVPTERYWIQFRRESIHMLVVDEDEVLLRGGNATAQLSIADCKTYGGRR